MVADYPRLQVIKGSHIARCQWTSLIVAESLVTIKNAGNLSHRKGKVGEDMLPHPRGRSEDVLLFCPLTSPPYPTA